MEMKMRTKKERETYIMYWKMIIWARMTKSVNCKSKEPTGRRVSRKRLITFTVWWCYNLANTNTAMQNTFSNTNTKIMRYKTSEGRMWDGKKIFALTNFEFFIQMKYLCICSHWQHVYDLRFFRGFDEVYRAVPLLNIHQSPLSTRTGSSIHFLKYFFFLLFILLVMTAMSFYRDMQ